MLCRRLLSVLVWAVWSLCAVRAGDGVREGSETVRALLRRAEAFETSGQWGRATELYARILGKDRNSPQTRDHYLKCLRRLLQQRRHQDSSYRAQVLTLTPARALDVYREVLLKLQAGYFDPERTDATALLRSGLEELRAALEDQGFRRSYCKNGSFKSVIDFLATVDQAEQGQHQDQVDDVLKRARTLAQAAEHSLGLMPAAVILELTCGACAGLDEYTAFLTPIQFEEVAASWKGKSVGVGIELGSDESGLYVAQVSPGSSAHAEGIMPRDRITNIGGRSGDQLLAEDAAVLLHGEPNTTVMVETLAADETRPRKVKLKRLPITIASISEPRFLDERAGVAYLRLLSFQEDTLSELDAALIQLQSAGMKALILDLRGNPGGLFNVAVQVAERFLPSGLIVSTHGQVREYNQTYYAQSMSALVTPLIIVVDGETASSAEVLAGALKENQRGMLVGQTTFGKGCLQRVQRLICTPAAIRMTVAKFYSPQGHAYTGAGLAPDMPVDRSESTPPIDQDAQIQTALELIRPLAIVR
jgi:carboxyl-terminal processing protease